MAAGLERLEGSRKNVRSTRSPGAQLVCSLLSRPGSGHRSLLCGRSHIGRRSPSVRTLQEDGVLLLESLQKPEVSLISRCFGNGRAHPLREPYCFLSILASTSLLYTQINLIEDARECGGRRCSTHHPVPEAPRT